MSIQRFLPPPTAKHSFAIAVGDRRILPQKTNGGGLTRNLIFPLLPKFVFWRERPLALCPLPLERIMPKWKLEKMLQRQREKTTDFEDTFSSSPSYDRRQRCLSQRRVLSLEDQILPPEDGRSFDPGMTLFGFLGRAPLSFLAREGRSWD